MELTAHDRRVLVSGAKAITLREKVIIVYA